MSQKLTLDQWTTLLDAVAGVVRHELSDLFEDHSEEGEYDQRCQQLFERLADVLEQAPVYPLSDVLSVDP